MNVLRLAKGVLGLSGGVGDLPLIIDTSKHNGKLTAEMLRAVKCVYLIARSGISWGYKDPLFDYYRALAAEMDIPFSAYHVIYPSQDPGAQWENAARIITNDPGPTRVPVWVDLELHQNQSPQRIADVTWRFAELCQKEWGGEKGIYSRTTFVDWYMRGCGWLNEAWWWLAQYLHSGLEHPGPYTVPQGLDRDRVLFQQTSHKGKLPGHHGDVDLNRWLQDEKTFAWLTGGYGFGDELSLEVKVERLVAAHPELFPEIYG
jgi:GH25 family lysozyme M1 (1,4-beta-N-acetylmuramidase)